MTRRRSSPGLEARATSTPPSADTTITPHADVVFDLTLLGGPDADVWAALFDGRFRLARRCDVCGRWLTAGASKTAGRGPRCAAKAVER